MLSTSINQSNKMSAAPISSQFISVDFHSFLLPNIYFNHTNNSFKSLHKRMCNEFTIYNKKIDKHIHAMVSIIDEEDDPSKPQRLVAFNESRNKYDLFEVVCIVRHIPNVFGLDVNNALFGFNNLMLNLLNDNSTITQTNILDDEDIQKDHKLLYDDMTKYVLDRLPRNNNLQSDNNLQRDNNLQPDHSIYLDNLQLDNVPRDTRCCPSQKPAHFKAKNRGLKFRKPFEDAIREETERESDNLALYRMQKLMHDTMSK